ncbi:MAG: GNAT family N-acetyltransferase [Anaerolineales bacterium]|nr:GNAT family N-acetyltransferase [Anaerolineales bacterium]
MTIDAPYTIRAATAADNTRLAEFGAAQFSAAFGADNTPENLAAYLAETYSPEKQAAQLAAPDSPYLIAEEAGRPVGYAWLKFEPAPEGVPGQRPMELVRFYVDRAWHGRGLAQALMAACLDTARAVGADALWLSTWNRNARGIAFYLKQGFRIAGALTFVVGDDPQTDWLMVREL